MTNPQDLPDDLDPLEANLVGQIEGLSAAWDAAEPIDLNELWLLFDAQVASRAVDHAARWLRSEHGRGYYTIGSAGHESNAAVALALRDTDPALLHYRSGGFYMARSMQRAAHDSLVGDPVTEVLRGMFALTTDQIAAGRHKVFGNHQLSIIPQTSTIASHLPRAVGLALSFDLGGERSLAWPDDSVVVCSLGDASLNHSTAQGAINWAAHAHYSGHDVPLLFVCEDNGLGISVASPTDWVAHATANTSFTSCQVDGADPAAVLAATRQLVSSIRKTGKPGFLHLRTVRYLGHAGTDVESAYRGQQELRADLDRDPIVGTARTLVGCGAATPAALIQRYLHERDRVRATALALAGEPEFRSAEDVMAPITMHVASPTAHRAEPSCEPGAASLTLAQTINTTLASVLDEKPNAIVFGEDVGRKGGVYGVTRGLQKRFGEHRVFDTLLDEQSILGLALGSGLNGLLPIPEIQYLAYLHNAEDQLRGEAATLRFFSQGQYTNPMVVRVASYAYQRGFGGHFHNDNSIAVLRDIPGIVIASPAHPADAGPMLRACVATAETNGDVCVYLEPIARYHTAGLHADDDQLWLAQADAGTAEIGQGRVYGDGSDVTILTWGNGLYLSLRAAAQLERDHGVSTRIVDLRWIAPMPMDLMVREASATGKVLVVDETRRTGGVGEGIITGLVENGFAGAIRRVAARDSFVPLGAAANLVLVSEADIVDAARDLAEWREKS